MRIIWKYEDTEQFGHEKKCAGQPCEIKLQLFSSNSLFACLLPSRLLFWESIFKGFGLFMFLSIEITALRAKIAEMRESLMNQVRKKFRSPLGSKYHLTYSYPLVHFRKRNSESGSRATLHF